MTIRKKIFMLAGILLALFAAVVGVLAFVQKLDSDQLANISQYELPLSSLVAEFDVYTDRYELEVLRALSSAGGDGTARDAAAAAARQTAEDLRGVIKTGGALMYKATRDPAYQIETRVELARMAGVLKYMSRSLEDFLSVGETTLAAVSQGRLDEARAASLGFAKFGQMFGPDLTQIRHELAELTNGSTRAVLARQRLDTYLTFAVFLAACAIGLGVSAVGSTQVVSSLRQLVVSAKAIESGKVTQPVVIRTRDEVGELALAFNRMIEELGERDRLKDTFGKFLDPRLVSRLIASGADQAERRSLTVFFSDIKQFSGISEQLTASSVVNLLNNYFGAVANVIHDHRGVIDKYIGDAVMAFWVPPFSTGDDHASDACRAALAQQQAIATLRSQLPEITGMRRNAPDIVIRMGIATGEAVVGTIGSESARSYTVIGDTVNLASRLESINKVYGTLILVSEETYRLAQMAVEAREVDRIIVAGKTEPVRIYELMALAGELESARAELRDAFSGGLAAYRRQDWDCAQTQFESCLRNDPDDGPTRLFLERIAVMRKSPPPTDWDGVWRHLHK
ncbi:adenylate/guanylate cyclase domain-containing protein [Bradyrhizobium jicamae]|uniref:adenylate/guanylate cyclase domain-containing protein n=1 Tax=Bradyrhizobium jicamae TaxID=280332 RepID=UPI001BAA1207|nr:adenylate/guanylate cyclase domain-containing protein [Bradyrhizobium jicamae]MBR0932502.1 HAMP domain-containing protein [Bradyrhizobium jicamae]